jgi:hypothetical protein
MDEIFFTEIIQVLLTIKGRYTRTKPVVAGVTVETWTSAD